MQINEEKFLQLLRSPDEANIELALEIAKGMPEVGLEKDLEPYRVLCQTLYPDLPKEMDTERMALLNHTLLDLSYCNFDKLPDELGRLAHLQELRLYCNELIALPESLGQLTQLRKLFLNDNQLTALPKNLGQLTQLCELDLYDNQFATLPDVFGQFTQLIDLDVRNNQLSALPESIGQLSQLKELYVSNNQLTCLPESIRQLTQLKCLYIEKNPISPTEVNKIEAWLPACTIAYW